MDEVDNGEDPVRPLVGGAVRRSPWSGSRSAAVVPGTDASRRRVLTSVVGVALLALCASRLIWPQGWHVGGAAQSRPQTFYVAADGDDSSSGTSPGSGWRTLARAGAHVYMPGERLLLQGGASFTGGLAFHQGEADDPAHPVVVSSYGKGRATIVAADGPGITVYDTAGVDIRGLVVTGGDLAARRVSGVVLFDDRPGGPKLEHVWLSDMDVSGFRVGVSIGGGRVGAGFRDVRVIDSQVHGNLAAGVRSFGPAFDAVAPAYANENVLVSGVRSFDNSGDPGDHLHNTGSGIELGSVRGAVVERSVAYGNGSGCDAPEGPVGIWAYDSSGVVLQHNISHGNRTGNADGGGFDLDQNVSDSVVQYNYSYDNDGPGILLYTGAHNGAFTRDTVRFNVSRDDSRKLVNYGSLVMWGRMTGVQVFHNSMLVRGGGKQTPIVRLRGGLRGVALRDNVFESDDGMMVASSEGYAPDQVLLQGNDYHVPSVGKWRVEWGSGRYSSLGDWSARTGQERVGSVLSGLVLDPGLILAPAPGWDPTGTPVPVPRTGSALAGRALNLRALFGVDEGPVDYAGTPLSSSPVAGAVQLAATGGAGSAAD